MAKAVLLAWSSPRSAERLAEFDEWYEGTHIPQVRAAVPSITAVARYEVVDPDSPEQANRYLAIYELDDSDVQAAAAAMADSAAAGRIELTTAMDMAGNPPTVQWCRSHPA
jgi:glutamate formiminotransferase